MCACSTAATCRVAILASPQRGFSGGDASLAALAGGVLPMVPPAVLLGGC